MEVVPLLMNLLQYNDAKVGDAGPILDVMAVMLENITTFPEALFHQLLPVMVHPDYETRVGAHRIFSVILVPSSVSPQKGHMNMQNLQWILMYSEDRSWMNCLIWSDEFERGVKYFLEKAFELAPQENEILCPYRDCKNQYWYYRDVVEDHLLSRGFLASYTKNTFHGENACSRKTHYPINDDEGSNMCDDIDGLDYILLFDLNY
ncbi:hypothetical protein T459_23456 [Capsicum annuum]|uniref:Transposase-associated domain-containing protein n=1 Tax=Capsicum annuum TaxID=4072 RepID=A0A2G2YSR2_CAPAN|nr:hypothetical protein T459_23456 [Capsicum annuum]